MVTTEDFKLAPREVIAIVIVCTTMFGMWYDLTTKVAAIPAAIRQGDVKVEMQTLRMELSYMAAATRSANDEITYQSKLRTLARLEDEWAELQK